MQHRGDARADEELAPIEYPYELDYLREYARDLYETSDGPPTWSEMRAWSDITGITLLPHEVRPVRALVNAMQARPVEASVDASDPLDFDDD